MQQSVPFTVDATTAIPTDFWNEQADLPGEMADGYAELADYDPTPRPYDFESELLPDNVIPLFRWDPEPEPPCGMCARPASHLDDAGLCHHCAEHLPRVGGCGLGVRIVAGLTSDTNAGPAIDHLSTCRPCRDFFSALSAVAVAGAQESEYAIVALAA